MKKLLVSLGIICLFACSEDKNGWQYERVDKGVYVIVRALEPDKNDLIYGAFRINHTGEDAHAVNFDWLLMPSGKVEPKIETDEVLLGKSSASEERGIRFGVFHLNISYADDSTLWLAPVPDELRSEHSTEYCITNYQNLGQLNRNDLSVCFKRN
ncbi:hypothetical protein PSECIP111854_04165 [Pseudoalteromonas sp. CIP111854]|uniref:Uncharacterized protein n=1 Tax=Pseudoalteromonas holothuriae TaxID=2963714 RepID=A0A9W4R5A5_9GAMM|nr:hypothetical protein [Pseudoalteromonas sp. CIP111854]CAH9067655.1 hypothetical protein PSECIP111854_04165 [Pseudoalteromonas sp. CIP111854]